MKEIEQLSTLKQKVLETVFVVSYLSVQHTFQVDGEHRRLCSKGGIRMNGSQFSYVASKSLQCCFGHLGQVCFLQSALKNVAQTEIPFTFRPSGMGKISPRNQSSRCLPDFTSHWCSLLNRLKNLGMSINNRC